MTRKIQLSFQKSDQACLLFLVTFYNYPARNIVDKELIKMKKEKNKIVTRNIQLSYPSRPSHAKKKENKIVTRNFRLSCIRVDPVKPKTRKRRKNKIVTRNIQLSYPSRPSHAKKKKNKIVTRNFQLSFQKSYQACLLFLVTFFNYPARNIVDKEQRKKKKKQKSDEKYSAVLS